MGIFLRYISQKLYLFLLFIFFRGGKQSEYQFDRLCHDGLAECRVNPFFCILSPAKSFEETSGYSDSSIAICH